MLQKLAKTSANLQHLPFNNMSMLKQYNKQWAAHSMLVSYESHSWWCSDDIIVTLWITPQCQSLVYVINMQLRASRQC